MFQTFTTLGSLLTAAGAAAVIVRSVLEDRQAFQVALRAGARLAHAPLPPRTHRVAAPRAARIIRMETPATRAAA